MTQPMTELDKLDIAVSQLRTDGREALAAQVAAAHDEIESARDHFGMIADVINEGVPAGASKQCPRDDMGEVYSWVANELNLRRSQLKNAHAEIGVLRQRLAERLN